jgi:hypothetical protein
MDMLGDGGAVMTVVIVLGVLLVTVVSMAVPAFFLWTFFKKQRQNAALLQTGQMAQACILQLIDTGTTINDNPQVQFVLDVRPPGRPPFQAMATSIVSRLSIARYQPGVWVQVRYDPNDPSKVAIAGM